MSTPPNRTLVCEGQLTRVHGETISVTAEISDAADGKSQRIKISFPASEHPQKDILASSASDTLPPVGFGTQVYFGQLEGQDLRLEPMAGEQYLDPEKALGCPSGYRFQEWTDRLSRGSVEFRLVDSQKANKTLGVLHFTHVRP